MNMHVAVAKAVVQQLLITNYLSLY